MGVAGDSLATVCPARGVGVGSAKPLPSRVPPAGAPADSPVGRGGLFNLRVGDCRRLVEESYLRFSKRVPAFINLPSFFKSSVLRTVLCFQMICKQSFGVACCMSQFAGGTPIESLNRERGCGKTERGVHQSDLKTEREVHQCESKTERGVHQSISQCGMFRELPRRVSPSLPHSGCSCRKRLRKCIRVNWRACSSQSVAARPDF